MKFGRKPALSEHQRAEVLERRTDGETLSVLAAHPIGRLKLTTVDK
jgi:hypothetical protein